MQVKHILVPVAFDDSSGPALNAALDLGEKFGAKITLLHVWSIPTPSYVAGSFSWPLTDVEGPARDALTRMTSEATARHADTDSLLVGGVAWEKIVQMAEEQSCDLIVVGSHGRRGAPRFLLGSVAEKVVRAATVPVLTVKPK
jgi:nucleotide-binding universal stress UspA family protein